MRQTWKMLLVLASLGGAVEPLLAARPTPPPAPKDEIAASVRGDQSGFRRPAAEELAAAGKAVQAACQTLDQKLNLRPDGRSAKSTLRLDELAALDASPAGLVRLDSLARHLGHHSNPVEAAELETLKSTLRIYRQRLRASQEAETIEAEYVQQLARLATAWETYRRSHDAATGAELQTLCRWLEERGQAEPLCQRLRREVSHTNHQMHVSAAYLQQALAHEIVEPLVSNDMSQGARVSVQGQIKGRLTPVLEPNARAGVVRMHFVGAGKSNIVAHKGRVTLKAIGHTGIHATETAYLTERGLTTSAPQIRVQQRSVPYSASVSARSRLVRTAGQPDRDASRPESSGGKRPASGSRHAEEDRRPGATPQHKIVRDANDVLQHFGVFALLGPHPAKTLNINTTAQRIQWLGRYASVSQFGAETPAPAVKSSNPAVLLQVHESAINNSENWIAGQTIGDSDFRELVFETFGMLAAQEQPEAQIPATITFADEQPLEARIADGRLDVALRLKAFSCGGMTFDGRVWTVRTSYQPQFAGGKVALVRTAPISVQSDSTLRRRDAAIRVGSLSDRSSRIRPFQQSVPRHAASAGRRPTKHGTRLVHAGHDAQRAERRRRTRRGPTDFRPTDFRPTDFRPTDFRPTDFRPTDFRPTDFRPTDFRPTDFRPTDFRPLTSRPLTSRPLPAAILTAFTRRTYRNLAMNVTRFSLLVACLMLCTVSSAAERTQFASSTRPPQAETLADKKLLLSFQGKGSSLAWDAGVVKRAYEVASALAENQVIVTGNSSGSVLAVYFSCFGFTQTSVDYAAYRIQHADTRAIRGNENAAKKAGNLLLNKPTEISPENLKEYVAFALGVSDWQSARDIAEVVAAAAWRRTIR